MATIISSTQFLSDSHGRRFADVTADLRVNFDDVLMYFNSPARQLRMEDSETHHKRPALAGVIVEFEQVPAFSTFLSSYDAHTTMRLRQAVGVIVRIIMEANGWRKTGRKGALGRRVGTASGNPAPGAYRNGLGNLSVWFTRAEHYVKKDR